FLFSSIIELQAQVKWEVNELVKNGRIDAIADLGDGIVIAGSRWPNPGRIFRSIDYGITWEKIKTLKEPEGTYHNNEILCVMGGPDDYVYLGFNTILASTFFEENTAGRGKKNIYITFNKGESWHNTGPIPTGIEDDWLDHVIRL